METICKGCPNACPLDNLSCDKGRALNGKPILSKEKREPLVDKFLRLGKRLEVLDQQFIEYGIEEDMLFNGLNSSQQNQLSALLDLLDEFWKKSF